jgi:AcrR family transcriptional regulator
VLDAAIDCFSTRSYDDVSLSQIASKAGVDIGLTRYYFGAKHDLWRHAIESITDEWSASLAAISTRTYSSAPEKLKAHIQWFIQLSAEKPQLSMILLTECKSQSERSQFLIQHVVTPLYESMVQAIQDVQTEGKVVKVCTRTLFFLITHGGALPLAVPNLTNALPGGDIQTQDALEKHTEAIISLIIHD